MHGDGCLLAMTTAHSQAPYSYSSSQNANAIREICEVVGTDSSTWGPLGGGGTTYSAGAGLALSGTTFAVAAGSGIITDGTSTRIDPSVVARKYAANRPRVRSGWVPAYRAPGRLAVRGRGR